MNNEIRDKFLTEAMGKCNHKWTINIPPNDWLGTCYQCRRCGKLSVRQQLGTIDFSTWQGFGKLWEWARQQDWWPRFEAKHTPQSFRPMTALNLRLINPDRFANAVYQFLTTEQ